MPRKPDLSHVVYACESYLKGKKLVNAFVAAKSASCLNSFRIQLELKNKHPRLQTFKFIPLFTIVTYLTYVFDIQNDNRKIAAIMW